VADVPYDALSQIYEWFVPEVLLTPRGSADAFAVVTDDLAPGSRILDCAAGTGELAVGLALRGYEVVATDASPEMIKRVRRLADAQSVDLRADLRALTCSWEQLDEAGFKDFFDAVFCVGSSLAHARGRRARRAALRSMAGVLRPGGLLTVTSRNWARIRARGPAVDIGDRLIRRGGRSGLTIHAWNLAEGWDERHELDISVAIVDDNGRVTREGERLAFWPFTNDMLDEDLEAAGLRPELSTFTPGVERYLVTARRPA
jgi:SAM-dependent methyltransferase